MSWQGWLTLAVLIASLAMLVRKTLAPFNTLLAAWWCSSIYFGYGRTHSKLANSA